MFKNIKENLDFYSVMLLGIAGVIFAIYWNYTHPHVVVKYDCSISEISPDYPIPVKEACRNFEQKITCNRLNKPI